MNTQTFHTIQNHLGAPAFGLKAESRAFPFSFQVWFYPPPSKISAENNYVCTAGLSAQLFPGACPRVELGFQFPGAFQRPQLQKLGMTLAEMIYDVLKVTHFTPNLLLTGLKRPLMPGMQDLLVAEGAGLRPLWIGTEGQPSIRMLHLIPVYPSEVSLVRQMGAWNTYRCFLKQKINFLQPGRAALKTPQYHDKEWKLARAVDVYRRPANPTGRLIQDIRQWYQANAPFTPATQHDQIPESHQAQEHYFGLPAEYGHLLTNTAEKHEFSLLWEYLYAGAFLPGDEPQLKPNPHFMPPD